MTELYGREWPPQSNKQVGIGVKFVFQGREVKPLSRFKVKIIFLKGLASEDLMTWGRKNLRT